MNGKDQVSDDAGINGGEPVRIRASRSLCRGWGNCHRWAPSVYFLDDDGHEIGFQHLEVPADLAVDAWSGADACPERAIQVLGARPDTTSDESVGTAPVDPHEPRATKTKMKRENTQ